MSLGAISADTVSRTRWLKRPWFWVSTIVLLAGVAAFALSDEIRYVAGMTVVACTYSITSAEDVDKAAALEKAVASKTTSIHRFVRDSATRPAGPPIGISPGSEGILSQPPLITTYEIKDRAEQDKVIAAVQATMRDQKLKRVDLRFMDYENWVVTEYTDASVGERAQSFNSGESGSRKAMSKKKAARKRSHICRRRYSDATAKTSNQTMKPTAPLRCNISVIATTPCRGLSVSR